jgi:predicted PurR-regulated permease PerM
VTEKEFRSPKWSTPTKALVALAGFMLIAALLVRFQDIIPLLIVAGIIAFLVSPLVRILNQRLRLPWALAANLVFLLLILLLAAASTATSLAVVQQVQALFLLIQRFLEGLPKQLAELSQQRLVFGPWTFNFAQFDLAPVLERLLNAVEPVLGRASGLITSFATGAIESIVRLIFILAVTYFLILDQNRIRATLAELSIPGYREDIRRLRLALGRIWNAFLRGQLAVVASTGVLTWMLMTALGVRFSLGLGFLGGVAKFVPILGPISAGMVAAFVALFQPSNWFGIMPIGHAVLVVISVFILDQAIDYILVPRIMGTSLNLHPVIILVGLLIGASLAGVIGLLLSAPMMATILLLGRYVYRKMVDLSPWDPPIDEIGRDERRVSRLILAARKLGERWFPGRMGKTVESDPSQD